MSGSTRWLVGVVAVVIAIVAAGVVAAVGSSPQSYPSDSPEHAVQQYVRAVADRDAERALSFMSAELMARCEAFPRQAITNRGTSSVRATLDEVTRRERTATVRVQLTETYGEAPFGGGESSQSVVFELTQTTDGWKFSEAPWPVYCPTKPIATAVPTTGPATAPTAAR